MSLTKLEPHPTNTYSLPLWPFKAIPLNPEIAFFLALDIEWDQELARLAGKPCFTDVCVCQWEEITPSFRESYDISSTRKSSIDLRLLPRQPGI